jgi:hypothetical protein
MQIRTIVAALAAVSVAGLIYAHHSEAQTVATNFEAAIPNIPGKSLVAVRSTMRQARPPRPTPTRSRPSSTPM